MQWQLDNIFKRRITYHLLFWFTFIGSIVFFDHRIHKEISVFDSLRMHLFGAVGFAIVVYINILILIPKYLIENRNIGMYLLSLLLTLVLCLPVNMVITYFGYPNPGNFIDYMGDQGMIGNTMFAMTIIVMVTTGLKFAKDWFNQQQRTRELMRQNLQSELKFLKSQVNPHFLFNTLNSLYSLTLQKDDRAPDVVLKLSNMMRYMLYECFDRRVPLEKEIDYIENYISLEMMRQGGRAPVNFNIHGNVNGQQISPLLFIPFLENSFKHGVNSQIVEGWVDVDLWLEGNDLEFKVVNSKPQIEKDDSTVGGIGLQNARRRLNLIYPNRHDLAILDESDTFTVNLKIELD